MKHYPHPAGINLENLLKMADYIETVPQDRFDMSRYRYGDTISHECNSVGCIIGHCIILDNLDNEDLPRRESKNINFLKWSEKFIGTDEHSVWVYLFWANWRNTDNTPTGAAKRIRYYIVNGLPENWYDQMLGVAPLSYL